MRAGGPVEAVEIATAKVKELRARTGAGIMDCKRALQETEGDLDRAMQAMRVAGKTQAERRAGRIAAEGAVLVRAEGHLLLEVNCETDFVARSPDFQGFMEGVADSILAAAPADLAALNEAPFRSGEISVEEARCELVSKIGENVAIRRFFRMSEVCGQVGGYQHGNRIGVLVDVQGASSGSASGKMTELARDIAMHICWGRPVCVSERDMPAELLERERKILLEQAERSGKPAPIMEKIIAGRLRKFLQEVTLLGQGFVKDPERSVAAVLDEAAASVRSFARYEVGEGLKNGD